MKKTLSFILSVCMCISCLAAVSLSAAAEGTELQITEEYILDMSGMRTSYSDTVGAGTVMTNINEKVQDTDEEGNPKTDENGDPVYKTESKTVAGVFVNKKITTPEHTVIDPTTGEETTVEESIDYEKCEFETDISNFNFTVENTDVISDIRSDGTFDIKKSGVTRLTAAYEKDGKTASASCFITIAETGRYVNTINQNKSVADPYYGEARNVLTRLNNNTYNASNVYGYVLGDRYTATDGKQYYPITMPKTYVISEWDYDAGNDKSFSSALTSEFTNINLQVSAAANSEYYRTRSFLENSRSQANLANSRYTETNIKRTKGWHQITAVIEPGTVKDDVNSAKVTLYIDGQYVLSYENVVEKAIQVGLYKVQELWGYATGFCIARCETSSASVKAVYPNDKSTNAPIDSELGIAFNGIVGEGYADKITVEKADGTAVPFTASLNTNGNKVRINAGRLDAETKYNVTVTDMPVQYKTLSYTKKGNTYIQSATEEIGTVSTSYSFTTKKADEGSYLEETLKNMGQQRYSMDYMRFADFSKSSEDTAEVAKILNDEHIKIGYPREAASPYNEMKDGVTAKLADGMLSVDFTAGARKGGSVSFYDLDSFKDYTSSDVVVASYKYKIRGDLTAIGTGSLSPIGTLSHIATNAYKSPYEISGVSVADPRANNGFTGMLYKDYPGGIQNRTTIIKPADITDEKWVEITYIIEYNDGAQGSADRKIKKVTAHGPSGTFVWDSARAGSEIVSKNLRALVHGMSANNAANAAIGFDFKDFEVYGFERPAASVIELNATKDGAAVNPDSVSGSVDLALNAAMGENITADVIITAKGKDSNKLVGCIIERGAEFKAGENKTVSGTITLGTEDGAYVFEAFIWDSVDGLIPLYPVTEYVMPTVE